VSDRKLPLRSRLWLYAFLSIAVVLALFPFVWLVVTSLKPFDEVYSFPPTLLPENPTVRNYDQLLTGTEATFPRMIVNSFVVSASTTAITLVLAAMAGYGLGRGRFRGRVLLLRSTLLAYLFPPILVVVPLFVIIANLGWSGTYRGAIAAYVVFMFPFATWLLTSYFAAMPRELEEAARVDGASNFRTFWSVVLPLTRPGLAAVAVFTFINVWNEFLLALVIIGGGENRTLAVGLNNLLSSDEGSKLGLLAAGSIIAIVPVGVLFIAAQRHIVRGLTVGAVKG